MHREQTDKRREQQQKRNEWSLSSWQQEFRANSIVNKGNEHDGNKRMQRGNGQKNKLILSYQCNPHQMIHPSIINVHAAMIDFVYHSMTHMLTASFFSLSLQKLP